MTAKQDRFKKLYRSENERIIAGIAGGLGEYFGIDPTLIRIIFVLLTVFGGSGILIYLILWILIPYEDSKHITSEETIRINADEIKDKAKSFAQDVKEMSHDKSRNWFGILIIILGILFLLNNFGFLQFNLMWPIALVILGVFILYREG